MTLNTKKKLIIRTVLGEDLEIIMLEMSVEEQEERVRGRHEGSQNAVDLMRVGGTNSNFMIVMRARQRAIDFMWVGRTTQHIEGLILSLRHKSKVRFSLGNR